MIFPIGDDQVKGGSRPIFSYAFILVNVVVFLLLQQPNTEFNEFTYGYSAVPYEITTGNDLTEFVPMGNEAIPHYPGPIPLYITLFTAIFMHGGWMHLIGNMLFLWVFADNIESTIGNIRFLIFYFLGGMAAHAGHILTDPQSMIPSLGASGAIAACLGAYLVMFPKSKIKVLFIIRVFAIPAFLFLGFWIVQQFISGVGSLTGSGGGVAWWAHIGGFIFGVAAGFFFKMKYPKLQLKNQEYQAIRRDATRYNNRNITNRFR